MMIHLLKRFLACLLLLSLTRGQGQGDSFESYDWRGVGPLKDWPKYSSLTPYGSRKPATGNYPVLDEVKKYPDDTSAYLGDSSYSTDFKSQPYKYIDNSAEYQSVSYGDDGRGLDDNFNITIERLGGFGGSGDTRGYGAYDDSKSYQELHPDEPKRDADFPELMRIGRRHRNRYRNQDPLLVRPVPHPL
ncbi:uncharacterized protein LOC118182723 isoform X1 [Stegodyphus dumicola]|uniref:uncharacterized protein LOC118182723 isoform X1 n=1 Tax=Stegodyphus dumicola TaxID=202533 RepID=UPI0015A8BBF2|nr:uncharacterized protein LOC118182723 isoform X1 [Stegodyphus dumicola]